MEDKAQKTDELLEDNLQNHMEKALTYQASIYIDECNARILRKLDILDDMATKFRLDMDRLEAMVAQLWIR
jgi:hypothetical protein